MTLAEQLLEGTPPRRSLMESLLAEKACAMAAADKTTTKRAIAFGKEIPDEELAGDGREEFVHVTMLFGFLQEVPEVAEIAANVVKDVMGGKKLTATLGKANHFECPDYDVVKIPVTSKDLTKVNKELRRVFPYDNPYDESGYKPHLTIAYVKKGEASKYDGDDRFEGKELTFSTLTFSYGDDRKKVEVKL